MRYLKRLAALAWLTLVPAASLAQGEGEATLDGQTLRVGTKVVAPFVVKQADGSLGGLSVDLWREIAARRGFTTEWIELEIEEMLEGVASGQLDAGIAALSVTPEREEFLDFTHSYFTSGLGIAVKQGGANSFLMGLAALMTPGFWLAVGSLALVLLLVGIAAWLAERKKNPEEFGGNAIQGIGNGFWFSAVTMTTVGYGDKAPKSTPGRFVSLIWMFASIIVISTFTGTIASSITAASLQGDVQGPDDLKRARIGTVGGTASQAALRDRGVGARAFDSMEAGLEAVAAGEIQAFVHDAPLLAHRISEDWSGELLVLDAKFDFKPYAIALPERSGLREAFNLTLLEVINTAAWKQNVRQWVGED
jgi:polar amino acid transport system substrate-binding protein